MSMKFINILYLILQFFIPYISCDIFSSGNQAVKMCMIILIISVDSFEKLISLQMYNTSCEQCKTDLRIQNSFFVKCAHHRL